jgi:lipoate-protein ligase A
MSLIDHVLSVSMPEDSPLPIGIYDFDRELIEATRADRRPRFRVYPFEEVVVVLGRGSAPEVELNTGILRAHEVPVLRRPGGGCAVVLDPGNVIVSVVLPTEDFRDNKRWFDALTRWLIEGLRRIGIDGVYHDGVSDLVLDDRKIAGSCIHRRKDSLYYSAALLVQPDIEQVGHYLRHPPREPDYRRGRSHADFMASLGEFPVAVDVRTFARALEGALRLEDLERPDSR